jgi:hypothetical protein
MDLTMEHLFYKRDDGCPSGWFRSGDWCYSIWQTIVRWVVIGVCVLLAIAAVAVFVIRRRRMRRMQPAYAPGWGAPQPMPMGPYPPPPPPPGHPGASAPDYYASEQGKMDGQYPPPYGQQQQQQPGYGAPGYGSPAYGVQQPTPVYQPPEGPPPGK